MFFGILISLLFHLFHVNKSGAVSPTITNTSGEYFILSYDTNFNKKITCSHSALCYVECSDDNSFESSTINAAATNNLTLHCDGRKSCQSTTISNGPQIEANIFCTASLGYACKQSIFFLNTTNNRTNNVNLECSNEVANPSVDTYGAATHGGCYGLTLWAYNADTVNVECKSYDCQQTTFHIDSVTNKATFLATGVYGMKDAWIGAAKAKELDVQCNIEGACANINIYPPYQSEYAFSLYCVAELKSCYSVDIKVPVSYSFTTNYMELNCPRTDRISSHCDIHWYCLDLSTSYASTSSLYNSASDIYYCNDYDCCPWLSSANMVKNASTAAIIPQSNIISPSTTNSTGQYYILSSSTSYSAIYCQNLESCYIECSAQDSCDYAYIYAGQTNYLTLICSGKSACSRMYITEGPKIEANIYCTANQGYGCFDVDFIMNETPNINLQCDNGLSTCPTTSCTRMCMVSSMI